MDEEGDIADGPQGPMIFTGGRWVPMGRQASSTIVAPNPARVAKDARDAADAATRLQIMQRDADMRAQLQALELEKRRQELAQGPTGAQGSKVTAKVREDALQAYNDASALERIATDLETRFKSGTGATKGLAGLLDYLPTGDNQAFDDASYQARGYVKRALGFTGGEGNTIGEIQLNYGPYLPEASNLDERVPSKIQALRNLAADSRKKAIAVLGGVPDANGQITPLTAQAQEERRDDPPAALAQRNPFDQDSNIGGGVASGGGFGGAITGNTGFRTVNDQALADEAFRMYRAGKSLNDINAMIQTKYPGSPPIIPNSEAFDYSEQQRKRGRDWNPFSATRQVPLSRRESFSGSAPAATLAGVANMGSFGGVQALAPEQYQAIKDASPLASMLGEVGGSISGAGAISKLGRSAAQKFAPKLLGGKGGAQFGRNLAADATYGAAYGGVTEGDPISGAAYAAAGSTLGQGVGSTLGRGMTGITSSLPNAQALKDAGLTLSLGQILRDRPGWGGKAIAGIEDRLAGLPVIGDMIGGIRTRGIEDFNVADMNNALRSIEGRVTLPGQGGYAQADQAVSRAYDEALGPMRLQPDEAMNAALAQYPDYAPMVTDHIENGLMTGEGFQAAKQLLSGERRNLAKAPGGYPQAKRASALLDELAAMGQRQAPDAMGQYAKADEAFAALRPIREAVAGAVNKQGVYTPAQKGIKLRATDQSAGKRLTAIGARPGQDFQSAAQEVLPSQVPDSGTIGRALVAATPLAALGGQQAGIIDPTTAALLAVTAMPYTKYGQKAAQSLMLGSRPEWVKSLGSVARKHKGLFGSATVPFLLEPQN